MRDEGEQIREFQPGAGSQAGQRVRRVLQPAQPDLAELAQHAVDVAGVADEVEGVDDRTALAHGHARPHPLAQIVGERLLHGIAVAEPRREPAQGVQVLHPDPPACASQQPQQFVPGAGIVDDRQRAHQVGDLRLDEQPADAEHVERNPALTQRVEEEALGLASAQQQRGRGRFAAAVARRGEAGGEPVGHGIRFIEDRLGEHSRDRTLARVRRRTQGLDPDVRAPDENGSTIRFAMSRMWTPLRQLVARANRASAGVEPSGELLEVRRARPAPAVDRLVGVPDRHHRVPGEQLGEQVGLHDRGVLILVEQHDPVPLAQLLADPRLAAGGAQRERDLVGVLDDAAAHLLGVVGGGEIDEHVERPDCLREVDRAGEFAARSRRKLRHLGELGARGRALARRRRRSPPASARCAASPR